MPSILVIANRNRGDLVHRIVTIIIYIRLSEKCLSFTDTSFITMHLYANMKPNLSNVVIFILIDPLFAYKTKEIFRTT